MTDLEALIEARHPLPEWATFRELGNGTGGRLNGWIDVAAFNVYPSKRGRRVAYEIKRYRSDWLRELSKPEKRSWCEEHFTECYFVALADVVRPEEVPEGWGLMVPTKAGDKLRRLIVARQRSPGPLPESITMAALRRAARVAEEGRARLIRIGDVELTAEVVAERLDHLVEEATLHAKAQLDKRIDAAALAAQEYRDAKRMLEAPLDALRRAVLGHMGYREELTAENVREWIRRVQDGQLDDFRREVESLRRQCDRVLGEDRR